VPTESFLDVARLLLEDGDAKAAFANDPGAFLAARGFDALSADDLADAAGFVTEALPPGVAARLGPPDALGDDPLGRFAALEPVSIDALSGDDVEDGDVSAADREAGAADEGEGFGLRDVSVADPGFGVGYTNDDVDDLSPPEVDEGELPVGFELPLDEAGLLEPEHELTGPGAHGVGAHELSEDALPTHDEAPHHEHDDADDPDGL